MKHWKLIGLIILVLAIAWVAYSRRFRIEAWVWHLKHGKQVAFESYTVPVPETWYLKTQENGDELLIKLDPDGSSSSQTRLKAPPSTILLFRDPTSDLKRWTSVNSALLNKRGITFVSSRIFDLKGETIRCLGGDELDSNRLYATNPTVWRCRTGGGLGVMITETKSDATEIWDIVSHIQRDN